MPSDNVFTRTTPEPRRGIGSGDPSAAAAAALAKAEGPSRLGAPPAAFIKPVTPGIALPPVQQVTRLLEAFKGASVAQSYRGPAWVDAGGLAWVVVVSMLPEWPRTVRQRERLVFMTWRWDHCPSVPLSLSAVIPGAKLKNPSPRWFGASHEPVVQAIRKHGRFMVLMAQPGGPSSGWFEASYAPHDPNGRLGLDRQFEVIGTPGLRNSRRGVRYDPKRLIDDGTIHDPLLLWAEPRSDFWATMDFTGPWSSDLQHRDRVQAVWGEQMLQNRRQAAGGLELLRDRYRLDGETPLFNADGTPSECIPAGPATGLRRASEGWPLWAGFIAAAAGPNLDAETAYEAAKACVMDPTSCWCLVAVVFRQMPDVPDTHLFTVVKMFVEAALHSPEVTQEGTLRPWLSNSSEGLLLKTLPLDMTAPPADVREVWRQGMEFHNIIDSGNWARGSDFPFPLLELGQTMAGTRIEGGLDAAEARTLQLLGEAIEARQWSIPWGAYIDLSIGPFVGMRIYEMQGEFACVFADAKGRYYLVAIGLRDQEPHLTASRFPRAAEVADVGASLSEGAVPDESTSSDAGAEPVDKDEYWDEDGRLTLQLVAAAVVRDFLVVEDREAVFSARAMSKRVRGHDIRTVVYLPRVNYRRRYAQSGDATLPGSTVARNSHPVAQHLRRAGSASAGQRFLAERYGVHVPVGFTFVRPHQRGAEASEERIRIYRSRSASRMLFEALTTAPAGARPAWFDFEKDCAALLHGRGLEVVHQAVNRDGDGGVDLFATDSAGQGWVVQCKCWGLHRPVGPEVVRELHGAIAAADVGAATPSRGIIMTTSRLTPGAVQLADSFGYEHINGNEFARLITL